MKAELKNKLSYSNSYYMGINKLTKKDGKKFSAATRMLLSTLINKGERFSDVKKGEIIWAGKTWDFFTSQITLADELGLNAVTINKSLKLLKEEGLISYRVGQKWGCPKTTYFKIEMDEISKRIQDIPLPKEEEEPVQDDKITSNASASENKTISATIYPEVEKDKAGEDELLKSVKLPSFEELFAGVNSEDDDYINAILDGVLQQPQQKEITKEKLEKVGIYMSDQTKEEVIERAMNVEAYESYLQDKINEAPVDIEVEEVSKIDNPTDLPRFDLLKEEDRQQIEEYNKLKKPYIVALGSGGGTVMNL